NRPGHSTDVRGRIASGGRLALSGPPAHAHQGLGGRRLETVREQPPCAFLSPDAGGAQTTYPRSAGFRARHRGDLPRDPTGLRAICENFCEDCDSCFTANNSTASWTRRCVITSL